MRKAVKMLNIMSECHDTCLPVNALKTAQIRLRKAVILHSSKVTLPFSVYVHMCVNMFLLVSLLWMCRHFAPHIQISLHEHTHNLFHLCKYFRQNNTISILGCVQQRKSDTVINNKQKEETHKSKWHILLKRVWGNNVFLPDCQILFFSIFQKKSFQHD